MVRNSLLIVAAAILAAVGVSAQLTVNTPQGLVQCQNFQLTFSGASGATQIAVFPAGAIGGAPLETLPQAPAGASAITWLVDIAANTALTFVIHDLSSGAIMASGAATVNASPTGDASCLGKNPPPTTSATTSGTVSGTGSASGTSPSVTGTGPSTGPGTGTTGTGGTGTGTGSSSSTKSSTSPATSPSSAASSLRVNIGAGLLSLFALVPVLA